MCEQESKGTKGVKTKRATGMELLKKERSDNFSAGPRFTCREGGPKAQQRYETRGFAHYFKLSARNNQKNGALAYGQRLSWL